MEILTEQKAQSSTGFIFACTNSSQTECLQRMLFGTNRQYGAVAMRVKKGAFLFLLNIDSDLLFGVLRAVSDGKLNVVPDAWNGNYPYQVKVESLGDIVPLENAKKLLKTMGISRSSVIEGKTVRNLLGFFRPYNEPAKEWQQRLFYLDGTLEAKILEPRKWELLGKAEKASNEDIEDIPQLQATTLWDFPRQSYGKTIKGDNKYAGVTPAELIWNLVWRYSEPGDLVVDPIAEAAQRSTYVTKSKGEQSVMTFRPQTNGKT